MAFAGAKQGGCSVRAREVLGGDDIDSDGDEAPRAEGEAVAGEHEGAAVEEVEAEPAPSLEPEIKREPSDSRRQQQQQQQPTCVRSAKRRAVWARGGAGAPKRPRGATPNAISNGTMGRATRKPVVQKTCLRDDKGVAVKVFCCSWEGCAYESSSSGALESYAVHVVPV